MEQKPHPGMMVTRKLRLVRALRRGGMGSVWVAHHEKLGAEVVVKFLRESLAEDPSSLQRFTREATAAAQVRSPYVVQILDHGVARSGVPFIVMELLEGHDLATEIRRGPVEPARVALVVEHVARALAKVHSRGIIHRDIKPSNIFLCDVGGGEVLAKLVDFGIAKQRADEMAVTAANEIVGTPMYMSPEQLGTGNEVGEKNDLWSLGVATYEALVGKAPFRADTVAQIAVKILHEPLPVPSRERRELPPGFDAWFARACARAPGDRFANAREMADALWTALGFAPRASGPLPPGSAADLARPSSIPSAEPPGTLGAAVTAKAVPRRAGLVVGLVTGAALVAAAGATLFVALNRPSSARPPAIASSPPPAIAEAADAAPPPIASADVTDAAPPARRAKPAKPPPVRRPSRGQEEDDVGF